MRVIFTRLGDRAYDSHVIRDDGTRYHVGGVGRRHIIPHDLAHFVIERALGLKSGFWGSIAAGAVFASMKHVSGRRRPHASRRSQEILRENAGEISEAEVLVAVINDALELEPAKPEVAVREAVAKRDLVPRGRTRPRQFSDEQIADACSSWREMLDRWGELPIGESLDLEWTLSRV
jgi:hypothetical protein